MAKSNGKNIQENSSDVSDSPTKNDLLGFSRLVKSLSSRISNATNEDTPITFGIYGEWGSGKTSFMQMIDAEIKQNDVYSIWFNAWKYDKEENLWSALIQTILDQIRIQGKWYRRIWVKIKIWHRGIDFRSGSKELSKALLSFLVRLILAILGITIVFGWGSQTITTFITKTVSQLFPGNQDIANIAQISTKFFAAVITFLAVSPDKLLNLFEIKLGLDYSKYSRSDTYKEHIAFLDKFDEELREIINLAGNGKPIVIFIDDLDRCLPEKAIQVLEAIKLFLDVDGCIFILAVDRNIVEKAIALKYKDLLSISKDTKSYNEQRGILGENYFEKIVQLAIPLPPISEIQIKEFITKLYPKLDVVKRCAEIFAIGLPPNPRKVKRILQSYIFYLDLLSIRDNHDFKPLHLAVLVIIQNQFRTIHQHLIQTPSLLVELEKHYRKEIDQFENGMSGEVDDPIIQELVESLSTEFPVLRKIILKLISDGETFRNIVLDKYIFLLQPVPTLDISKPSSIEVDQRATGVYLRQLISELQIFKFRGISSTKAVSSNFETSYVSRTLIPFSSVASKSASNRKLQISDIFKESVRSIILGDPGSGKTALLHFVALVFARSMAQGELDLITKTFKVSTPSLPVLVHLRRWGGYLNERRNQDLATPAGFVEFLNYDHSLRNLPLPEDFFEGYFNRGNCILLLDGLDEIADYSLRTKVAKAIASFANRYPTVRILVTSRIIGYRDISLDEFSVYQIDVFDDDGISRFAQSWFRDKYDTNLSNEYSEVFLRVVLSRPELQALAVTPLLLTILLMVFEHERSLPEGIVDVYERSIDVLLQTWDQAREIEFEDFGPYEKREFIEALALEIHKSFPGKPVEESFIISLFSDLILSNQSIDRSQAIKKAELMLRQFTERAGLIVEVGKNLYRFVHLTYEEFLSATAISKREDLFEIIVQYCNDPRWRYVFIFLVGYVSRTSPERANDIIKKISSGGNSDCIILAGICLNEIPKDLTNKELLDRVMKQLEAITNNDEESEQTRTQTKKIINELKNAG